MIGSKLTKPKTAFYESHLRHCALSEKYGLPSVKNIIAYKYCRNYSWNCKSVPFERVKIDGSKIILFSLDRPATKNSILNTKCQPMFWISCLRTALPLLFSK